MKKELDLNTSEFTRLNMQYILLRHNTAKTDGDRKAWSNLAMKEFNLEMEELAELIKGSDEK